MKWFFIVIVSCHVGRFKEVEVAYLLLTGNESYSKTCVGSGQRMLTCFVRGHINVQLTCCFICWDSAPFLMLNWQQIYLFGRIQTSQTECHTCLYKWVSIVWFGILEFIQANCWSFPQIWTIEYLKVLTDGDKFVESGYIVTNVQNLNNIIIQLFLKSFINSIKLTKQQKGTISFSMKINYQNWNIGSRGDVINNFLQYCNGAVLK